MNYADLKLVEEAKQELVKAFKANAALRATKVKLEKSLGEITKKLMKQEKVDAILNNPKYKTLSVLREKGFLSDIEKQVAKEYAQSKKKLAKRIKDGNGVERKRMTDEEKKKILIDIVKRSQGKELLLADIKLALEQHGITQPVQSWLKPLALPPAATKAVSGARRDGTYFRPKNVPWLKDAVPSDN